MAQLLDGKQLASELYTAFATMKQAAERPPLLTAIIVGDDPASHLYVNNKAKACAKVGIRSDIMKLPAATTEEQLSEEVARLNGDPNVDGILIQLPLPHQIDSTMITRLISPDKDVDGFHPTNQGKLLRGEGDGFIPCTPLGVQLLLQRHAIAIAGQHVVIVGRSNIVGKPLAALLMQKEEHANASVTLLHSQSRDIARHCRDGDILITAMGQPHFITPAHVKKGAVVVDVGINRVNNRFVGDVEFDAVKEQCRAITPVPGGVGPMTIAMLLYNTLKSYARHYPQCCDLSFPWRC